MAPGVALSKQQAPVTPEEITFAKELLYLEIVGSLMYLKTSTDSTLLMQLVNYHVLMTAMALLIMPLLNIY